MFTFSEWVGPPFSGLVFGHSLADPSRPRVVFGRRFGPADNEPTKSTHTRWAPNGLSTQAKGDVRDSIPRIYDVCSPPYTCLSTGR